LVTLILRQFNYADDVPRSAHNAKLGLHLGRSPDDAPAVANPGLRGQVLQYAGLVVGDLEGRKAKLGMVARKIGAIAGIEPNFRKWHRL
jgi:hypothetical protein